MSSRTALVLQSQGDPLFGAIANFLFKGGRRIFGAAKRVLTGAKSTAVAVRQAPAVVKRTGQIVRVAKSKPARVIAEAVALGTGTFIGARAGSFGSPPPGFQIEDGFVVGPGGCPTGKVIEVAAHQRVIPLDRFGRPRRRINVLNTKALSRATRRLGGFQKRARRVEKQLARIAPRSRRRSSSKKRCD